MDISEKDILETLYNDAVVDYLATRYHTSPRRIIDRFIQQKEDKDNATTAPFHLETNEMELLSSLTKYYRQKSDKTHPNELQI